jgi:hypothetical protein
MTQRCSVRTIVSACVLVCVLVAGVRPAAAEGRGSTGEAQLLPIVIGCSAYSLLLGYSQHHSRTLPPITGNSGVVYRCGIAGVDMIILEEVLDPYHQQLSSDIYNTLIGFESVQRHFFEQEGISHLDYKARCDLTIESGCPMNAQFEVTFTISAYTAEDFCLEEGCICRENWHCEEGLVCALFFPDITGSHGECRRGDWWFD